MVQSPRYQIKILGLLDESWSDWFEGMEFSYSVTASGGAITVITGPVKDQSALHGLLNKVRDLNLGLISIERVMEEPSEEPG